MIKKTARTTPVSFKTIQLKPPYVSWFPFNLLFIFSTFFSFTCLQCFPRLGNYSTWTWQGNHMQWYFSLTHLFRIRNSWKQLKTSCFNYSVLESWFAKIHHSSYLLDESEVMADKHHSSFKFIDSICQSIYCFYVQMVGGFIEEKHVRILPGQPCKAHAALLPIREVPNGAHLTNTDTICSSAGYLIAPAPTRHTDHKIFTVQTVFAAAT